MMEKPIIAGTQPIEVDLVEGVKYSYCTCGLAATQPFCDGTHKEPPTGFKSLKYVAEKTGKALWCMCKQTKTPPFCDGSHLLLSSEG